MLGLGSLRLLSMARLLLAQEALLPPGFHRQASFGVRLARRLLIVGAPRWRKTERGRALSDRICRLGPFYIKLGQFLATRPDIIGTAMAADLQHLQDRLPAFDISVVHKVLAEDFDHADKYITDIGPPIAAASIAQVHTAKLVGPKGGKAEKKKAKKLAIKVLRPNIEKTIAAELTTFTRLARWVERLIPSTRRLRPMAMIDTLRHTLTAEIDLRLEAAALSEMAENCRNDEGFAVPQVIWQASSKRVLAMHWIEGVSAGDMTALKKAGHNMPELAVRLVRIFLTQALRDGFFHADLHQGNLLVQADAILVGIDLGINGRLDKDTRRFLAEILHGFITRDYMKIARVHFEAGYVPPQHKVDEFAQALRSIGEPIRDQNAENISMARLLAQLFAVTGQFDMQTQPQLLLLQKTMVTVEGVARSWHPQLNIWDAAEPVVSNWLRNEVGPQALLREAADNAGEALRAFIRLPHTVIELEKGAKALQKMAQKEPSPQASNRLLQIMTWLALLVALVLASGVWWGAAP